MARATVELDFFAMAENKTSSSSRGFHSAISRINPNLLRSVVDFGAAANWTAGSSPSPIFSPNCRNPPETKQLTIFYNGTVSVFHVSQNAAENVIRAAERESGSGRSMQLWQHGDLPMARRHSLQRFLEKRRDRLTATAPYVSGLEVKGPTKERVAMANEFESVALAATPNL